MWLAASVRETHPTIVIVSHSPITSTVILLVRGPSSSSRKMFCQVPLISLPSWTEKILVGPIKDDARWASALSSTLSCSHPAPLGKSCWTFLTMSFVRPVSCSFTIMAVVEWTVWITHRRARA